VAAREAGGERKKRSAWSEKICYPPGAKGEEKGKNGPPRKKDSAAVVLSLVREVMLRLGREKGVRVNHGFGWPREKEVSRGKEQQPFRAGKGKGKKARGSSRKGGASVWGETGGGQKLGVLKAPFCGKKEKGR